LGSGTVNQHNGLAKIQISGIAEAKTEFNKCVKTRIKTSNFMVVAPMVLIENMEILDNGDLLLVVKNNGNIDAKEVQFNISISLDIKKREILFLKFIIINEDYMLNKYLITVEITKDSVFKFINQEFIESLIKFHESKINLLEDYEQLIPIPIEADGRERLVCVIPVAA